MRTNCMRQVAQLISICQLLISFHKVTVECAGTGCSAICDKSDPPPESPPGSECPPLPSDCVVTNSPCYCNCPTCRRKLGEPCSENKPICEDHLVCQDVDGREKEDLYWWNIFTGGTCHERSSGDSTARQEFNDSRRIVTYVFILVTVVVLVISLSYVGYLFFRQKPGLHRYGSSATRTSYDTTAAELVIAFFGRLGKPTARFEHRPSGQQTAQDQCEMELCTTQVQETHQVHEALINTSTLPPPPYSVGHCPQCVTIFSDVTLPEYTELRPNSRPPSYDKINDML